MKAFSKIVRAQYLGDYPSTYGVHLLPVTIDGFECLVALTTETILLGVLAGKTLITNFCLKLKENDFQKSREMDNSFKVISMQLTEDQSIGFQLSQRVRQS